MTGADSGPGILTLTLPSVLTASLQLGALEELIISLDKEARQRRTGEISLEKCDMSHSL